MTNRLYHIASFLLIALISAAGFQTSSAQATHQVSMNVEQINRIALHGNVTINLETPAAGQNIPDAFASSSYSMTTNAKRNQKVTASLDENLPGTIRLWVRMDAPGTGQSRNWRRLRTNNRTVLRNLQSVQAESVSMEYRVRVELDAAPGSYVRTVTYTLTQQ